MFKFFKRIKNLFSRPLDPSTLEEMERILYEADVGSLCTQILIKAVKTTPSIESLTKAATELLSTCHYTPPTTSSPHVILITGINGSGKTTTAAKLAKRYKDAGKEVLLVAGDTFRAAAVEQLAIWAKELNIGLVRGKMGADPSAVIFDALTAAKARSVDIVIIDTAGRLQSKTDLMHELEKIRRVSGKVIPEAPHETFLVIDATIGQNGLDQARIFHSFTPLSGLILTKWDSTAKGGVILPIHHELKIPVAYIGVGEKIDDLKPFDVETFVNSLF
ncbi:MAG: signal recognition particle-docking protein FtsY [Simkaniaceae bacterium]|nr:signal recognition particle-docking protein FtsY [Simkaniaceae bacterium]